ncbi:MAG TPA: right-handed parallel beta-helix repeat-containing protein [bacterium]|nr:right-handed parallel beta-helix repeat-containing protein [bacterium]
MNRILPGASRRLGVFGAAWAVLLASAPASAQQIVSTTAQLEQAVSKANAGTASTEILIQNGTYSLSQPLPLRAAGTIVRSQSGSRDAVVLEGSGMTSGVTHVFHVFGHDVTIADLTLRNVWNHAIQIHGEGPASADRTVLRNLVIQDTGEQMVKVSYKQGTAASSDGGLVEGCLFEYTAGIGPQYYIGGIDAHQAQNWTVRGNTFRGIRSPDSNVAEHAVHFWSDASGTLVERNLIINCDRGIGFGLGNRGHQGGIIRNNMIYHADLGADRGDVGIELESAAGAQVYNNTVYQEHAYQAAISVRWGASSVYVANNLCRTGGTGKVIWKRDGPSVTQEANVVNAQAAWFVDVSSGDLRLAISEPSVVDQGVAVGGLTDDFDGRSRPAGGAPDIGASEYGAVAGGSSVRPSSWGALKAKYR